MTVLLYVKKRTNRLERFVLYTNLIISNFITCIYRKLTINYSKFHMKNYQACFFYKDLANSRIFSWHARWEKRLPPLPKKLAWPSMSSNPPPPPPPPLHPHKFAPKRFWPFWWENPLCQQLTSVWKPWTFFFSKLFLIITFVSDDFRSFPTLEMNKTVMLKVWRSSYHQVFHFISASVTLVDVHQNWLNWYHFLILTGSPLLILIDCMISLSSYLYVTRMTMSTVFFLLHLVSAILYLQNVSL